MTSSPHDALLDRLCRGDPDAAEGVFRKYEPYLRRLVRRMLQPRLRAKFDSADVVQSVWADLLVGFRARRWHFADEAQLRAFLVRMTRNRFLDRYRQARVALDRERPLAAFASWHLPASPQARPSENAHAVEVWERLLALCPPGHRDVLRLRRLGLSRAEVAERTGLHEGSVRRILRRLARAVAFPGGQSAEGSRQ
jgi:RNA polymerase sigma factor (sigma-70 family)